jgi:hypothetical protein
MGIKQELKPRRSFGTCAERQSTRNFASSGRDHGPTLTPCVQAQRLREANNLAVPCGNKLSSSAATL